jgi:hypothetical protein
MLTSGNSNRDVWIHALLLVVLKLGTRWLEAGCELAQVIWFIHPRRMAPILGVGALPQPSRS